MAHGRITPFLPSAPLLTSPPESVAKQRPDSSLVDDSAWAGPRFAERGNWRLQSSDRLFITPADAPQLPAHEIGRAGPEALGPSNIHAYATKLRLNGATIEKMQRAEVLVEDIFEASIREPTGTAQRVRSLNYWGTFWSESGPSDPTGLGYYADLVNAGAAACRGVMLTRDNGQDLAYAMIAPGIIPNQGTNGKNISDYIVESARLFNERGLPEYLENVTGARLPPEQLRHLWDYATQKESGGDELRCQGMGRLALRLALDRTVPAGHAVCGFIFIDGEGHVESIFSSTKAGLFIGKTMKSPYADVPDQDTLLCFGVRDPNIEFRFTDRVVFDPKSDQGIDPSVVVKRIQAIVDARNSTSVIGFDPRDGTLREAVQIR